MRTASKRGRRAAGSEGSEDQHESVQSLQQAMGNRAVVSLLRAAAPLDPPSRTRTGAPGAGSTAVLQRNWGTDSLGAIDVAKGWSARFRLINGWSMKPGRFEFLLTTTSPSTVLEYVKPSPSEV